MYNHWLEKSDISTDLRNGRHVVHKKEAKIDIAARDLEDKNITKIVNKWVTKVKAQKYIYSEHEYIVHGIYESKCHCIIDADHFMFLLPILEKWRLVYVTNV